MISITVSTGVEAIRNRTNSSVFATWQSVRFPTAGQCSDYTSNHMADVDSISSRSERKVSP